MRVNTALALGLLLSLLFSIGIVVGFAVRCNQLDASVQSLVQQNIVQDQLIMTIQMEIGTAVYTEIDNGTCTNYYGPGTAPFKLYLVDIGTLYIYVAEIGVFDSPLTNDNVQFTCDGTQIQQFSLGYAVLFSQVHLFLPEQLQNMSVSGPNTFVEFVDGIGLPGLTPAYRAVPSQTSFPEQYARLTFDWTWKNDGVNFWDSNVNSFNFLAPTRFGIGQATFPISK